MQKLKQFPLYDPVTADEFEKLAQQTSSSTRHVTIVAAVTKTKKKPTSSKTPPSPFSTPERSCYWCETHTIHGKTACPAKDNFCRKYNNKGHFQWVCLTQKRVAAVRDTEFDDYDLVASLSYRRRHRHFVLWKMNNVARHFLVNSGNDITVVEQSVARKKLKLQVNYKLHKFWSIGE